MQILLIEDEKRLAAALKEILEKEKYMVDLVYDGNEAMDYIATGEYDVIIMDVMLPNLDGFTLAKRTREAKVNTPIIMLTAKTEISDKVHGLDSGADDYMTKPFAPSELLARIRALTRRHGEVITDNLGFADFDLNLSTCELSKGTKSVHLNFKEFELLKLLINNHGTAVTKDSIITKIWGYDSDASDNNVEAYISFLRKKLAFLGSSAKINALRKVGYVLEDSDA